MVRIFFFPLSRTVGYITGGCLKSKSNVNPLKIEGYSGTTKPQLGLTQKEKELIGMTSSSVVEDTVFKPAVVEPVNTEVVDSDDETAVEDAPVEEPVKEAPKKKKVIKRIAKP